MIISVTNLKGGVGKSTVAQNLAVCFAHKKYKTCIIDTDTNQTSMKWVGMRDAIDTDKKYPRVAVFGGTEASGLPNMVKSLKKDYEIVLIDGTPALSKMTSKILLLADLVVIPSLPSLPDFWALQPFLERFEEAKALNEEIVGYILCNGLNSRLNLESTIADALKKFKEEYEINLLKTQLHQRVAYKEVVARGLGVFEYKDKKAKAEVVALTKEIEKILKKL